MLTRSLLYPNKIKQAQQKCSTKLTATYLYTLLCCGDISKKYLNERVINNKATQSYNECNEIIPNIHDHTLSTRYLFILLKSK